MLYSDIIKVQFVPVVMVIVSVGNTFRISCCHCWVLGDWRFPDYIKAGFVLFRAKPVLFLVRLKVVNDVADDFVDHKEQTCKNNE